jgi:hypothetical protein
MSLDPSSLGNSATTVRDELERVFRISSWLDFPFTVDEVAEYFLPGLNLTGDQVKALFTEGTINVPFSVHDRFLFTDNSQSEVSRTERNLISAAKLESSRQFLGTLTRLVPWIRTAAVTGSVAYESAREWDDIDIFMVTEKNRLWISLLAALIFVRVGKLLRLRSPHLLSFCLSYVHDEAGFLRESSKSKSEPLFARELLKALPLVGVQRYREILEENAWVQSIHRAAYLSKMKNLHEEAPTTRRSFFERKELSPILNWVNGFVFVFLSAYLRVRGHLANAKLKSEGLELRVFEPVLSTQSCMYVSNLYRWLHQIWEKQSQPTNTVGHRMG